MQEPIIHYYNKLGINTTKIKEIICGDKYVAVLLKNGNIGVCSTLQNGINITINDLKTFDISLNSHRVVAIAYFNALLNYKRNYPKQIDIFNEIDFSRFKNIVMIGYFGSLTDKFKNASINLSIFDLKNDNNKVVDIDKQKEFLTKADVVILTSTSVFNNTFIDIVNTTSTNCIIYTLGPSTILDPDMFKYNNVHTIFGSVFKNNDMELLEIIRNGGGTKKFLHLMEKVCFENYI
ncbi:MAG: DUF364 domain-containing protein [Bacteroidota bacterium]